MRKATIKSCTSKFTIIQTTMILKSYILRGGDSQTWERQYSKNGGKIGRENGFV